MTAALADKPANPKPQGPIPPIPLTIVTGFLGAGKTTLVNRLLKDPALADTVVIVNEFGEIGLDHLLMESVADGLVLMQSGCLCCTIRGDLVNTLEGLLRKRDNGRIQPFRRVLIETTGLADPAPVLQTVMAHPYLSLRYALMGVVTLVDAVNGEATLDGQAEAVKQAAVADRLVVSKLDLVTPSPARGGQGRGVFSSSEDLPPPGLPLAGGGEGSALLVRLRALNPAAPILDARSVGAGELLDCGPYDPTGKAPDVARWLNDEAVLASLGRRAHRHADGTLHVEGGPAAAALVDVNRHDASIRAHAFASDKAIPAQSFALFQELLRTAHGPKLLRMKGIVKIAENPDRPAVIHGVQHVFHAPMLLDRWPDADERTRIVFVTKDLEPTFVEGLWEAFLGA
jgi:G3E family GTPase